MENKTQQERIQKSKHTWTYQNKNTVALASAST